MEDNRPSEGRAKFQRLILRDKYTEQKSQAPTEEENFALGAK